VRIQKKTSILGRDKVARGLQSNPNDVATVEPDTHAKIQTVGMEKQTSANLCVDQPRNLVQFGQIDAHSVGRARGLLLRRAQILEQHTAEGGGGSRMVRDARQEINGEIRLVENAMIALLSTHKCLHSNAAIFGCCCFSGG
jgi:hypothetical protein